MFNLLFSRLNYQRNFDTVFNRDKVTLEDVLNEEDIKSGFINPTDAMAKFFDDHRIKQLIDYIVVEPSDTATEKEGHKYPFVSHEILKSQSGIILDHFFPSISMRKDSATSKGRTNLIQIHLITRNLLVFHPQSLAAPRSRRCS